MDNFYAILRYAPGQSPQVLYSPLREIERYKASGNLSPDLLQFIEPYLQQAWTGKEGFQQEYTYQKQDLHIHFIPEDNKETNIPSVLVIIQATEELDLQKKDLLTLIADLKVFFRKGAHDMKNIFSNVALLLQTKHVDKAKNYLTELQEHYLQQIDDFYAALDTFVNIQKPALPQVKNIAFQSLIAEIIPQYSSMEEVTLETSFEECTHMMYREDYLLSMIKSLIDNAMRYRQEGQPLMIRMKTEKIADKIIFSIEDNGIGIDMDRYEEKLFTPFQRFTRQSNGQGISLHLLKVMVEKNGGTIHLRSTLHQGTKVILTLKEYEHPA